MVLVLGGRILFLRTMRKLRWYSST